MGLKLRLKLYRGKVLKISKISWYCRYFRTVLV